MKPARRLATVALAAAALLSACGSQAGSAAVVGDQTVTVSQVDAYVTDLKAQLAAVQVTNVDEAKATSAAVQQLTRHLIFDAVAAKEGITVTQGDIDAYLHDWATTQYNGDRAAFERAGAEQGYVPAAQLPLLARDSIVSNRLVQRLRPGVTGNDALAAYTELMQPRVAALGVQVAPRFGTWNVVQLGPAANDLSAIPGAVAPVLQPPAS